MPDNATSGHNPWKLTAIGMALVAVTALVTGVVVASRTKSDENVAALQPPPPPEQPSSRAARPAASSMAATTPAPHTSAQATQAPAAPRVPDQAVVKACNDQAAAATGPHNKTTEVVKDSAIGAVVGAAVGAAGGAIAGGGKGAGKGAAIGGILGGGGGALYGVNDNRKHDAAYRDAYASCLRVRGYAS